MADTIRHRGPDDEGLLLSGRAAIAARRLSIIDVGGGHQPIPNETGTIWAAFNGEIYNHPELISHLRARGHRFRTRCDTEALVHMYEEYGLDFLDGLDGMFALAIWDQSQDMLVLGRDQLGIKPLYYADLDDQILFASELKPLVAAGIPRALDVQAVDAYLTLSYVPAPHTVFEHVRKLPPGHMLVSRGGESPEIRQYWELGSRDVAHTPSVAPEEHAEELLRLLRRAVSRHMISDVPLGAFLSGGLDSSAVVALMAEQSSRPVKTFSIGFQERSYDETSHARVIAQMFGTEHHELVQSADPLSIIDKLPWMYDEPFADSSALAVFSLAGLAKQHVTVALTGDGGDEVFGGYLTYRADALARAYRELPAILRDDIIPRAVAALPTSERKVSFDFKARRFVGAASLPEADAHLGWKTIFRPEVRSQLLRSNPDVDRAREITRALFARAGAHDTVGRALYADMMLGLPDDMLTKVDRATMAVSLEARVPLLDRGVVEFMASLPTSTKVHGWELKHLFKRAVAGILPEQTRKRKKEGFNLPIGRWLRYDLRSLVQELLTGEHVRRIEILDPNAVENVVNDHLSQRADRGREVWSLLMFALWHTRYVETASRQDTSALVARA